MDVNAISATDCRPLLQDPNERFWYQVSNIYSKLELISDQWNVMDRVALFYSFLVVNKSY